MQLKGRNLVASARGQKFVRGVLDALREARISISVVVLDKPFVAAAVIIEDCCDPMNNPRFDNSWTRPSELKERMARAIYSTVHASILEAAWVSRREDAASVKATYDRVFGILEVSGNRELAELAQAMREVDYVELTDAVVSTREHLGLDYSPNLTTFVPLLQFGDQDGFKLEPLSVGVVHDQQLEFDTIFATVFERLRNASPGSVATDNGDLRYPLLNMRSLSFADSESEIGIVLADIVASAVRVSVQQHLGYSPGASNDFIRSLRKLFCTRPLLGAFPMVIAPIDRQSTIWQHLAPHEDWTK